LNLTPQTLLINLSHSDVLAFSAACKAAITIYNDHIDTCNKQNLGNSKIDWVARTLEVLDPTLAVSLSNILKNIEGAIAELKPKQ
jgi:hypothetical protein